jgi:hypothetical protein
MHRDRDIKCIAFSRIRGSFAACSSRVLVVNSTAVTDALRSRSPVHRLLPHQGQHRRLLVSGSRGEFDCYDRYIEIVLQMDRLLPPSGTAWRHRISGDGGAFDCYNRSIGIMLSKWMSTDAVTFTRQSKRTKPGGCDGRQDRRIAIYRSGDRCSCAAWTSINRWQARTAAAI